MTQQFSETMNALLIILMLLGYILISIGVIVTRRSHRKDVAELSSQIEQLKADVEALKKG